MHRVVQPSVQPMANPETGSEHRVLLDATGPSHRSDAIRSRDRAELATGSALSQLAFEMVLARARQSAGSCAALVLPVDGRIDTQVGQGATRSHEPGLIRIAREPVRLKEVLPQSSPLAARLSATLLAAGLCGQGAIRSTPKKNRARKLVVQATAHR
jgi:hypothetical protein